MTENAQTKTVKRRFAVWCAAVAVVIAAIVAACWFWPQPSDAGCVVHVLGALPRGAEVVECDMEYYYPLGAYYPDAHVGYVQLLIRGQAREDFLEQLRRLGGEGAGGFVVYTIDSSDEFRDYLDTDTSREPHWWSRLHSGQVPDGPLPEKFYSNLFRRPGAVDLFFLGEMVYIRTSQPYLTD